MPLERPGTSASVARVCFGGQRRSGPEGMPLETGIGIGIGIGAGMETGIGIGTGQHQLARDFAEPWQLCVGG